MLLYQFCNYAVTCNIDNFTQSIFTRNFHFHRNITDVFQVSYSKLRILFQYSDCWSELPWWGMTCQQCKLFKQVLWIMIFNCLHYVTECPFLHIEIFDTDRKLYTSIAASIASTSKIYTLNKPAITIFGCIIFYRV